MKYLNDENLFDYSLIDPETAEFLRGKEYELLGINNRYSKEVGKVFYEAQQKLSNNRNGTFDKWIAGTGFKKQNVHNYINIYKNVQNLDDKELDVFEDLPKSLQIEMSKPSANKEANKKVYEEDITTHKEYKELERKLKTSEETINRQSKMIDDLNEREPQIVEKEIVPNDYEQLKTQNKQLEKELSSTRSELDLKKTQYSLMKESSAEAEELKSNIEQLKTREKNLDEKIKAMFEFNELMQEIGSFFDEKMASMRFKPLVNELSGTDAVHKLEDTVNMVDFWVTEMRKITPNQNTKIIEGEIVNE